MTGRYFNNKKVMIVCLSLDEELCRMAEKLAYITSGDLCNQFLDMNGEKDSYELVFIGCKVEDHTFLANMSAFLASHNLKGKTVVPFCTYTSARPDDTLQHITKATSDAGHLTGLGIKDVAASEVDIQVWINFINEQWYEQNADDSGKYSDTSHAADPLDASAPMQGTVNLWRKGNIPAATKKTVNADGADFIPNMRIVTVHEDIMPKGVVIICPGGAFLFRGMWVEGYNVADMLVQMGYQCFVLSYRISPYTMQEITLDLQRAIRYVSAHARDYRIDAGNIALVGFSAGGLLCGDVLLGRDRKDGTALDASYCPDVLDGQSVSVCAIGMIYSFYGQLSLAINDVEQLRAAHLPPTFYSWGSNDSLGGQILLNIDALRKAGGEVETLLLKDYPHGYGTGGSPDVWLESFDAFLMRTMSGRTSY